MAAAASTTTDPYSDPAALTSVFAAISSTTSPFFDMVDSEAAAMPTAAATTLSSAYSPEPTTFSAAASSSFVNSTSSLTSPIAIATAGLYYNSTGTNSSLSESISLSATHSLISFTSIAASSTPPAATSSSASAPLADSSQGIASGAKAGIAAAAILFLVGVACLVAYWIWRKRRLRKRGLSDRRDKKRDSFMLGSGRYGPGLDYGFGGSAMSEMGRVRRFGHGYMGDGLEKVGRYENAVRGLPLPRIDGDRVATVRTSRIEAWMGRGGFGR